MVYTSKRNLQMIISKLVAVNYAFNETEKYLKKKIDICVDLDITSTIEKCDIKRHYLD